MIKVRNIVSFLRMIDCCFERLQFKFNSKSSDDPYHTVKRVLAFFKSSLESWSRHIRCFLFRWIHHLLLLLDVSKFTHLSSGRWLHNVVGLETHIDVTSLIPSVACCYTAWRVHILTLRWHLRSEAVYGATKLWLWSLHYLMGRHRRKWSIIEILLGHLAASLQLLQVLGRRYILKVIRWAGYVSPLWLHYWNGLSKRLHIDFRGECACIRLTNLVIVKFNCRRIGNLRWINDTSHECGWF